MDLNPRQESILVGCVPPACQPYVLLPPDVSTDWEGGQLNKFEQVSSYGHQMSLAVGPEGSMSDGREGGVPMSDVGGGGGGSTVRSNASWVMVAWRPSPPWTDTQT